MVVLLALVGFRIVLHLVGRWTIALAVSHTVIELLFAIPVVYLAINGMFVNPAFAASVGYPTARGWRWPGDGDHRHQRRARDRVGDRGRVPAGASAGIGNRIALGVDGGASV